MSESTGDEHFIRKAETTTLSDDAASVDVRKIFTPAGERLELEAPMLGRRIRLDAMELEALSWQDTGTFESFLEDATEVPDREQRLEAVRARHDEDSDADPDETDEPITITNEFAEAHVQRLSTAAGDRLEITAPKLGYQTRLGPADLEGVTLQNTETFTAFLEEPFGPNGH